MLIIAVTLGLTAAGLFFVLGRYRDDIAYGNLEDLAALTRVQTENEIVQAAAGDDIAEPKDEGAFLLRLQGFLGRTGGESAETSVMVVDDGGRVLAGRFDGSIVEGVHVSASSPDRTERCRMSAVDGPGLLCVYTPLPASYFESFGESEAVALVVAQPSSSLGEVFGDLLPQLVLAGIVGVAAAFGVAFVLSKSISSPLGRIAGAARRVSRGNYNQRVPVTGPREVREVAANFNRMTAEVQRSQQTLRDFLMNISHEIKTPLTSIRGFSQAVMDGTIDDTEGVNRSAKIINNESTRVLRLVEELLDLSRLESGQVSMRQEDVELAELFTHVGDVFQLRSEESDVALEVGPAVGLRIRGDFDRLEQVLNNLLDNAFRHTPSGGTVMLRAGSVANGLVQVSISDTGKGIPPEDVPHLFDRFYRATNGRNQKGYGLGLAITREIVRAHGGDIRATSEPGRGTSFSFTLPAATTEATRQRVRKPRQAVARANS